MSHSSSMSVIFIDILKNLLACTVGFVKLIYDRNLVEVEGDYAEKQKF